VLAAFHRATDGALIGLVFTVVVMSIVSLHAQHLWALSFSRLETSRDLIHKFKESISILESHFLASKSLPKSIVTAKTSNLLYLDKPDIERQLPMYNAWNKSILHKFIHYPINQGY
tara:strand:+ start:278 stop:625 length:348 start_codon:yes stop_codon:yes gene_type:complete